MQVAAPIRDSAGHIRGALALIINPDTEFSRILSVARQGESGETYAFDQEGLMISRSRFEDQLKELGLIQTNASSALSLELRDPGGNLTTGFKTNSAAGSPELIQSVAAAVRGDSGVTVVPFRHGGHERAFVLPDADWSGAARVGGREVPVGPNGAWGSVPGK